MIEPHCHTREWIEAQREALGAADTAMLERAVFALVLLDALARTDLEFVFKGGTSLLLHLPTRSGCQSTSISFATPIERPLRGF